MSDRIVAYFDAWTARDADAVLASLGGDGTYEDPVTAGPIGGDPLRAYLAGLWSAFPDLSFEILRAAETGPDCAAAEWMMRGTNAGPMNGLPPTGRQIELRGADFFRIAGDHVASVTGYFDGGAIPRQLGLDVIVQPRAIGPFRFGTSVEASTGRRDEPGAFSITCLHALDDAAAARVGDGSRMAVVEMLGMEGFIGATMARIGDRMVTVSAWTDAEASRSVLREGAHATAMRDLIDGSLASSAHTSVWSLDRDNGFWVRCDACGRMTRNASDESLCACGEELPGHPPYW